jgi:hypothetical protein
MVKPLGEKEMYQGGTIITQKIGSLALVKVGSSFNPRRLWQSCEIIKQCFRRLPVSGKKLFIDYRFQFLIRPIGFSPPVFRKKNRHHNPIPTAFMFREKRCNTFYRLFRKRGGRYGYGLAIVLPVKLIRRKIGQGPGAQGKV